MAYAALKNDGTDKFVQGYDAAEDSTAWACVEIATVTGDDYGWYGVATHVEGDAVASPGGFTVGAAPVVLVAGDDGTNAVPLQVDASAYLKVILQTGTAAVGKLAANTGVDIGDVDVLSIIPGTAATNLGKAIDSAAGATDTGVASLAIRDDTLSALSPAEGDWIPLRVNSTGALHVTGAGGGTQYAVDAALGATPTGTLAVAIRDDALSALTPVEGDAIGLRVDANGALWTHDDALDAALSGSELQVDVVAALPAGTNAIGKLAANTGVDIGDVDVTSVVPGTAAADLGKAEDAGHTTGDVGVMALTVRQNTAAALSGADADYQPLITDTNGRLHVLDQNSGAIKTAVELIDNAISGSEMQVDVVAALPAGSNAIGKLAANTGVDIGDVDVTSVIPGAGATNLGKAEDAAHSSSDVGVMPLAVRNDTLAALAGTDGDYAPLQVSAVGALFAVAEGGVAHDGADVGYPVKIGGRAQDIIGAEPEEVADNDRVDALFDMSGRLGVTAGSDYKYADINDATSGDNTIIAAQAAGKRIAVWAILIVSDGTADVRWEDGAGGTAFTGQVPLQAREGYSISAGGLVPLFVGSAATLLNLELSAAVNQHGFVSYTVIED